MQGGIQRDPVFFDELQQADRYDGLGHGCDPENIVRLHDRAVKSTSSSISPMMNLSPVLHDQCDPSGDLLPLYQGFHAFVDG